MNNINFFLIDLRVETILERAYIVNMPTVNFLLLIAKIN
jgi:hypothetical protein